MTTSLLPRPKKNKLPKFDLEKYSHLPATDLVVFAIHLLNEQQVVISLENIVSACFWVFPQKFALKNYAKWPDSATVHRRWADARAKGFISGTPEDGYKVTFKGTRIAGKTAKALGIFKEKPKAKKTKSASTTAKQKPARIKKQTPRPDTQKKKAKATVVKSAPIKRQTQKTVTKKQPAPAKPKAEQAKAVVSNKRPVTKPPAVSRSKKQPKPVEVRKTPPAPKADVKPEPAKNAPVKPIRPKVRVEAPAKAKSAAQKQTQPQDAQPVIKKKSAPKKSSAPQTSQPVQPALITQPPAKPKKKSAPTPPPVANVSKEEKDRAARFVKSMERSDAYRLYKSKGKKAEISEFDFRSLLLCTMESSAETLMRNLNTFKNYADIQNRKDLVEFLNFNEGRFAALLVSGKKKK